MTLFPHVQRMGSSMKEVTCTGVVMRATQTTGLSNARALRSDRTNIRIFAVTFHLWPRTSFRMKRCKEFHWTPLKKRQSKIQKVLWQITSKICVVHASEDPSKSFFLRRFWSKLAVEPLLVSGQTTMNTFPLAKIAAALTKQWGYPKIMQCWGWGEGAEDFEGPWWLGISRYS